MLRCLTRQRQFEPVSIVLDPAELGCFLECWLRGWNLYAAPCCMLRSGGTKDLRVDSNEENNIRERIENRLEGRFLQYTIFSEVLKPASKQK